MYIHIINLFLTTSCAYVHIIIRIIWKNRDQN